jgi:Reverse transcriptase (RNA-dependent DNA polymerase)
METEGKHFYHRRGLRQGDLLSPLLFVIVTDTLQSLMQKVPPVLRDMPNRTLQFADGTMIIMDAHPRTLQSTMTVLNSYAALTGLQINIAKSEFIPIAVPPTLHETIGRILGCPKGKFPLKYLGLPLSNKRLRKEDYMPVLKTIQDRLAGGIMHTYRSLGAKLLLIP